MTRRELLALAAASRAVSKGQGIATRGIKPAPRSKPSGLPFHARFTDVAKEAGLRAPVIYGGTDRKNYILETVGCGVAFFDYDHDGWLDIFVLGGSRIEGAPEGATNRLYRNNRDGTFSDVTDKAGLRRTGWASSVTVGDFNNDGWDDLFITYWGQNVLYRNNGDGTFTDITEAAGLLQKTPQWGSGCAFVDYNRDGFLDLFIAHYLDFDFKRVPKPGETAYCNWKGVPVNCGPRGLPPGKMELFRNNGDGTFTDVSEASGVAKLKGSYGMTVVAADFDNDGWQDIYVACDSTASFLLRNNHDGTFTDIGLESGVALNQDGMEQAGMGIGIGDYNLDGHLDIFKTHFADDTPVLYRNNGKANFDDVTLASGLGAETRFVGWGAGIVDVDNDGLPDLFCVTGNVYPELEAKVPAYPFRTPRVIYRNLGGGKFEEMIGEAGPGIEASHSSRGCAFGDFDNDGDIDVVVINLNEPPSLLRNDVTGGGHWLKVKLIGTKSNRSAIGATVIAIYGKRKQAQAVLSQSSFYSVNDFRLHFGLGAELTAALEIRWPSGMVERIAKLECDRMVTIMEGAGILRAEPLKAGLPPFATVYSLR